MVSGFLIDEADAMLIHITDQIIELEALAKKLGTTPYKLRDANGGFVFVPLLHAKALALHTRAMLETERIR